VWTGSIETISEEIDISEVSLDGTHTVAKKGGESVAYQKRKRAKISNSLPIVDAKGYIIASTGIIPGNHNDLFNIRTDLQEAFNHVRLLGMNLVGSYFNADAGFDSRDVRKLCFNRGLIPNIPENKRNRKSTKKGRKGHLTLLSINADSFLSVLLLGSINSDTYSLVLTAKTLIS
jgi:hypothetical protein